VSLNSILGSGLSGLQASQTALRTTSNNIANANTAGFARQQVDFTARSVAGAIEGVDVARIQRVADRFLEAAALRAGSATTRETVRADLLDRAQARFGDPGEATSLPGRLQAIFDAATLVQSDPTSALRRADLLSAADQFFNDTRTLTEALSNLRAEADVRLGQAVSRASDILATIQTLNGEIARAKVGGGDATGAEDAQARAVAELSALLDVRVEARPLGGVTVRTTEGLLLVGESAGALRYVARQAGEAGTVYGKVQILLPEAAPVNLQIGARGGEIGGLIAARDEDLAGLLDDVAALASTVADVLDRAVAGNAAVPAPNQLSGRVTGLIATDAMNFTGRTTVAVVNADGTLRRRVDIDFSAPPWAGQTVGGFAAALNAALGPDGTATLAANGRLDLSAATGAGIVIADDPALPAERGGKGLAHTFGLGTLTRASGPLDFATWLTPASPSGFSGTLQLRLTAADGRVISTPTITAAGPAMSDMIAALNAGLAGQATASLDARGRLVVTPAPGGAARLEVIADTTQRGATNLGFSALFGLGEGARVMRTVALRVDPALISDPRRLALAQPDLTGAAVGDRVLETGDGRGAAAFTRLRGDVVDFDGSAGLPGGRAGLSDLASRMIASVGSRAAAADRARDSAESIQQAASQRLSAVTGVNLDEEIVRMTTFQQSYAASARLIQAAQQMYDVLLQMV